MKTLMCLLATMLYLFSTVFTDLERVIESRPLYYIVLLIFTVAVSWFWYLMDKHFLKSL